DREQVVSAYTQAGLFAEDVLPQLYAALEELRALIAKVEAAMPINGKGLRAANAQDQERFDAAFTEASGHILGILDFAETKVEPITSSLLALKNHPVVTSILPQLTVPEPEPEPEPVDIQSIGLGDSTDAISGKDSGDR